MISSSELYMKCIIFDLLNIDNDPKKYEPTIDVDKLVRVLNDFLEDFNTTEKKFTNKSLFAQIIDL